MLNLPKKCVSAPYYCTENALSSMLGYLGVNISPTTLHEWGCDMFDNAIKCMPKKYEYRKATLDDIMQSVKAGQPAMVSIVPEGQDERHTVVVIGYDERGLFLLDNCDVKHRDFKTFGQEWKRTNNKTIINMEVVTREQSRTARMEM